MSFLYGFKAARLGRSRCRLGAHAFAPATAPTPVGWREHTKTRAAIVVQQ
jgi:hypothetical protein